MDDVHRERPSWIDVLALVTVIVVGVALGWYSRNKLHRGTWDFVPPRNVFLSGARQARHFLDVATPVGFGLAVVGLARVLREPRSRRRLLLGQPGAAACAALVAALGAGAANTAIWTVRWFEFGEQWATPGAGMFFNLAARNVSYCILAAWAFLAFGGLWTHGRNWVNWLGCALGMLAVAKTVLWCLP
jgi:hypothetical protein